MNIYNMSIRKKLIFVFSLIIFITTVVGTIGIIELKKQISLTENIFKHPYTVSNVIKKIHSDIMTAHALVLSMIIHDDRNLVEEDIEDIIKHNSEINKNFNILFKRYLGPKKDVEKALNVYKKILETQTNLIEMIQKGNLEKAKEFVNTQGHLYLKSMQPEIKFLSDNVDNKAQHLFNDAIEKERYVVNIFSVFMVIIIALSLYIAYKIIHSILYPLNMLMTVSEKIDEGELSTIDALKNHPLKRSTDEIGKLFNSIYTLINNLLVPYANIIKRNRSLVEMTDEVLRLLESFDKYIIASKTDKTGKIIYASKAFQNISGYTEEELLGKDQNIVRHPDTPSFVFKNLWQTIQSGKTWDGEIKNRKKDGSYYWVYAYISPDIDRKGNIIGYSAIREDITLTKAYEKLSNTLEDRIHKEIEKNNKKTNYILQQSRLAQMGEMISMIAHQWRQPLSSISAISGTLTLDVMMDNYNDKYFQERLESISELSQHLSKTVDDFRGFFKEDKQETIFEIKNIIDDSISIIGQTLVNNSINLSVKYIDNPKIKAHSNELKQVILNLLKNAEDILLEKNIQEAKIWIKVYVEDSNACINIEDNAGGVPEDIIDKVFTPYFSTKKEKDGTGLGLYMSNIIVQDHCHGKLLLENAQNGASFTIKIPLYSEGK